MGIYYFLSCLSLSWVVLEPSPVLLEREVMKHPVQAITGQMTGNLIMMWCTE